MTTPVSLDDVVARIRPPDEEARTAARQRQGRLTKPTGALGRLEELSVWAAGVQGRCPPRLFERIRVVLVAADHGIAQSGVSAYPPEVTAQMLGNFLAGGAAVNVLARQTGASVRVVDMGVCVDVDGADNRYKVCHGTRPIDVEDALDTDQLAAALRAGVALVDDEVDGGADLLVPGDMGIGSTTPCAAVTSALLGLPAAATTGRGTGIDDETLSRKRAAVDAAVARVGESTDPLQVVGAIGGADLATMTAMLIAAAARRTPVVLDGVVSCTAALVASRIAPHASDWWVAGHRSSEPAQRAVLDALGLAPVIDLELRLGEGTGALVALPIVQMAIATLGEMATFDEAGVSDRDD
jgi:nicotinate-nucleotide--dimethylbenzimidazole phosphoribosyltransferase